MTCSQRQRRRPRIQAHRRRHQDRPLAQARRPPGRTNVAPWVYGVVRLGKDRAQGMEGRAHGVPGPATTASVAAPSARLSPTSCPTTPPPTRTARPRSCRSPSACRARSPTSSAPPSWSPRARRARPGSDRTARSGLHPARDRSPRRAPSAPRPLPAARRRPGRPRGTGPARGPPRVREPRRRPRDEYPVAWRIWVLTAASRVQGLARRSPLRRLSATPFPQQPHSVPMVLHSACPQLISASRGPRDRLSDSYVRD